MQNVVGRSKTGLPTVDEIGGGWTNTGSAQIVCGPNGERLNPLFVPSRGYCNESHAVFVAKVGLHLIEVWRDREGDYVTAYKIVAIGDDRSPDRLETEEVGNWARGDGNIPSFLDDAVSAACQKANHYHC